jgi:CRP-like cAMP-binding protein
MPKSSHRSGGSGKNRLLAQLSTDEREGLASEFETVSLSRGTALYEQGSAVAFVYFPLTAVISLLTILEDGSSVEVATVGNEGVVGLTAYLELERAVVTAVVQLPGEALRLDARQFASLLTPRGRFHTLLARYTRTLLWQITRSAGCNRFHSLEQRCARWLLSAQDRAMKDDLPLTHEFLSGMLGASRQATGVIIERLEKARLIQTSRGTLKILNRHGIEPLACECYWAVKEEGDSFLTSTMSDER